VFNKLRYFITRYWVSILFLGLAIYFLPNKTEIFSCSPHYVGVNQPKTLLGLGEMTWMWILMAIAHGANYCYCDIKYLLKKK